jgi:hypothetical protein
MDAEECTDCEYSRRLGLQTIKCTLTQECVNVFFIAKGYNCPLTNEELTKPCQE